jgi:hypothetical protein
MANPDIGKPFFGQTSLRRRVDLGHTVVGVFRHSGDADLAATQLRDEYILGTAELDVLGEADWPELTPPAPEGIAGWVVSFATAGIAHEQADDDPLGKRWIDKLWDGRTMVIARSGDPEKATMMAKELRTMGAERVDLLSG